MTCYSSLRVLDKAAHKRGPACTQSGTMEMMGLCGQERKREGSGERESTRKCECRDGEGRPARGSEVLSKMLCFPASWAMSPGPYKLPRKNKQS